MSIAMNLIDLAVDEGNETALRTAQEFQLALESMLEVGDDNEKPLAADLLRRVNRAIEAILEEELVLVGREYGTDSREFQSAVLERWLESERRSS